MKYVKPEIEVIQVNNNIFMAQSATSYSSAQEALTANCGGYNGAHTNNFNCSDFGGYNATNPPTQNAKVVIAGGTYVFDYKGNHWKLEK